MESKRGQRSGLETEGTYETPSWAAAITSWIKMEGKAPRVLDPSGRGYFNVLRREGAKSPEAAASSRRRPYWNTPHCTAGSGANCSGLTQISRSPVHGIPSWLGGVPRVG